MADDPVSPPASDTSVSQSPEPSIRPEPASDLSAPSTEPPPSASESANTQPVQDQPEAPLTPEPAQPPETPSVEPVPTSTSPQTEPPISTPSAQVVPPEVIPVTEEVPTVQPTTEPQIPSLHYPYYMSYPVTFDFGAQPTDDEMKKKYQEWGIIGHNGIDFGLPEGTEVLACDEGTVTQVGDNSDFGISITLKHSWGTSIYGHLQSFTVLVNDHISKAQVIGLSDHTGYAIGPHLHFGIQPNNPDTNNGYLGYINPASYLMETSPLPVSPQVSQTPQPENPPDLSAEKPTEETPVVQPVVPLSPVSPQIPLPAEASAKEGQPVTSSDEIQKQAVAMFDARVKENSAKGNQAKKAKHDEALQKIMQFTQEKKKISNEQARDLLHISQSSATNYLTELVTRGMLKTEGKGKATVYLF